MSRVPLTIVSLTDSHFLSRIVSEVVGSPVSRCPCSNGSHIVLVQKETLSFLSLLLFLLRKTLLPVSRTPFGRPGKEMVSILSSERWTNVKTQTGSHVFCVPILGTVRITVYWQQWNCGLCRGVDIVQESVKITNFLSYVLTSSSSVEDI